MNILNSTGEFEISENGQLKVTGRITLTEEGETTLLDCGHMGEKAGGGMELKSGDIYKDLRLRGYDYETAFRGIVTANSNGKCRRNARNSTR